MDEFPSNSQQPRKRPQEKEQPKKVTQVASAKTRKKPLGKRLKETFFGGDTKGVIEYVVTDVLVPAARDMIADAASQGVERMIFGEARSTSRRTGARPTVGQYQTPYNRYSRGPSGNPISREPQTPVNRRMTEPFNFDEIVLATRIEAEMVLDRLNDLLEKYENASVADLYDLVGISGSYTDDKYGWYELRGASIHRVRDGYVLDLPRPDALEK